MNKIRILGIDYKVMDKWPEGNVNGIAGQCDNTQNIITVCKGMNSESHYKSVLLHEIIEAINYRLELKLDHPVITCLETGLFQVLSENPKLLELFKRE